MLDIARCKPVVVHPAWRTDIRRLTGAGAPAAFALRRLGVRADQALRPARRGRGAGERPGGAAQGRRPRRQTADHLYVVDQPGKALEGQHPHQGATLFLDVPSRLVTLGVLGGNSFDERGFLGVAFHPNYQTQRLVLHLHLGAERRRAPTFPTTLPQARGRPPERRRGVAASTADGVDRHQPPRADARRLAAVQPRRRRPRLRARRQALHPDGRRRRRRRRRRPAFVTAPAAAGAARSRSSATGDGNAQKLTNPLGKILRIDVERRNSGERAIRHPEGQPVRRHGRRRARGDLGVRLPQPFPLLVRPQDGRRSSSATSARTTSRRWTSSEGRQLRLEPQGRHGLLRPQRQRRRASRSHRRPRRARPADAGLIDPVAQYDTHHEGHSVIGGFVYRGRDAPGSAGATSSASSRGCSSSPPGRTTTAACCISAATTARNTACARSASSWSFRRRDLGSRSSAWARMPKARSTYRETLGSAVRQRRHGAEDRARAEERKITTTRTDLQKKGSGS